MLEQLFGSQTRTKLLHLFLEHPDTAFFVREITREIGERINSVRRELLNLEKFGLIIPKFQNQKKFYQTDKNFVLFADLKKIIDNSIRLAEKEVADRAKKLEGLKYLALTGKLVKSLDIPTDVLVVGKITEDQLNKFVLDLEKIYRTNLRYTYLTLKEFNQRRQMTDKFLYSIINGPKVVIVDTL